MLVLFAITALVVFVSSLDLGWSNLLTSRRNDIVFEGRNHEYGAFTLRKEYHLNLFYALLLSIGAVGLLFWGLSQLVEVKASVPMQQAVTLMDASIFFPEDSKENEQRSAPKKAAPPAETEDNREVTVVEKTPEPIPDPVVRPIGDPSGTLPASGLPPIGPFGDGGVGTKPAEPKPEPPVIHEFVQRMPMFPGGDDALLTFVQSNVDYDHWSIERGIEGTIYVSFVILPDGGIGKVEVIRGLPNGKRLEESVVRTIQSLPRWEPGMQNNKPVAVRKTIPVHFQLK